MDCWDAFCETPTFSSFCPSQNQCFTRVVLPPLKTLCANHTRTTWHCCTIKLKIACAVYFGLNQLINDINLWPWIVSTSFLALPLLLLPSPAAACCALPLNRSKCQWPPRYWHATHTLPSSFFVAVRNHHLIRSISPILHRNCWKRWRLLEFLYAPRPTAIPTTQSKAYSCMNMRW